MALINCPECGKEISDQAEVCINCGYQINPVQNLKTKKKANPITIIILAIVILVIALASSVAVYMKVIKPKQEYAYALETLERGAYDDAINLFTAMGDYGDSYERVKEAYYKKGMELYAQKSYDAAIGVLRKAGGYGDSMAQIDRIQGIIDERDAELRAQERIQKLKDKLVAAKRQCYSDGTYLTGDGLTLVIDGVDKDDVMALVDAYSVAKELGLPDSLIDEMAATNALMGKQSASYEDYEVSWSYHPDSGLDVFFKIKE